jgi:peptidoglycan hydrolase CwlO-like protein
MIVISLVAVALSALSAMAFYPPAFRVGRVTAARAKTTVVAYADNANSKDNEISELKAENLNLKFKVISDKIDHVDSKIEGLEDKIEGLEDKIEEVKIGIVVIACLCAAPQLSSILALLKK